jgi:hypothetical protein
VASVSGVVMGSLLRAASASEASVRAASIEIGR